MEDLRPQPDRVRTRDSALRVTRGAIAGVAAGAVALSGVLSVVAAQAFKGRPHRAATRTASARAPIAPAPRATRVHVPGPESVPSIANDPAPLQPPAQPPAAPPASVPQPSAPAPAAPQVSGGS